MSKMQFSVKHERGIDEAKQALQSTVDEVTEHFALLVNKVEWNDEKTDVKIDAKGADVHAWIDAVELNLTCDVPMLSKILGGPVIDKIKGVVEERFQKKLTEIPES